jgi:thiamine biosynthesis lipoprotein
MIRRARPLLGTIVAISADAPPCAVSAAFAAIERVHLLMSAQRCDSDIGRINRNALRRSVRVHPWTFEVLERAAQISELSGGAFDIAMPGTGAHYTDIVLEQSRVRLRRPARLDVSGIAKGFAVDLAVDMLQANGARTGSVNAGGDLRFFGDWQGAVRVRAPGNPGAAIFLPPLAHKAFATSSGYFGARLNDPRTGARAAIDWSVTVAAATCLVADALTKAVALLGPARSLLEQFDAAAFAVDGDGGLHAAAG